MTQTDIFSYHNTTNSSGKELVEAEQKAYTQEQQVFRCFLLGGELTALEVAEHLQMHESSARRSVTNLANKGMLIKTDRQKIGKYGKMNYLYKLK